MKEEGMIPEAWLHYCINRAMNIGDVETETAVKRVLHEWQSKDECEVSSILEKRLKPCPFCGGEALLNHYPVHRYEDFSYNNYYIVCGGCGIETPLSWSDKDYLGVEEQWNRRAGE